MRKSPTTNLWAAPNTGTCGLPLAEPLTSALAAHAQRLADVAPTRACPALATHLPGDRRLRCSEPFAQPVTLRSETGELNALPPPWRPPSRRPGRHRRGASRPRSRHPGRLCRRQNRPVARRKQRCDLVPRDQLRQPRRGHPARRGRSSRTRRPLPIARLQPLPRHHAGADHRQPRLPSRGLFLHRDAGRFLRPRHRRVLPRPRTHFRSGARRHPRCQLGAQRS